MFAHFLLSNLDGNFALVVLVALVAIVALSCLSALAIVVTRQRKTMSSLLSTVARIVSLLVGRL
jgi:hypothetical protein